MPCQQARVLLRVLQILVFDLHRRSKKLVNGQDFVVSTGLGWVSAAHTSLLSLFEMHGKHEKTECCHRRSPSLDFGSVTKSKALIGIAALLSYVFKDSVQTPLMRSTSRSILVMRMVLLAVIGVSSPCFVQNGNRCAGLSWNAHATGA